MSQILAARNQVKGVATDEGGLDGVNTEETTVALDGLADPIELPDGKVIYPTKVGGIPVHKIAAALLDMQDARKSKFLKLIGPPGTGKSQTTRAIAHHLWTDIRGKEVETRDGEPFYGLHEMSGGPSSDELTFKYEFVPDGEDASKVALIPSAFVKAMEAGEVCVIDEPNTIRDIALLSLNGVFDGRAALYLPALGRVVTAQPGFACILTYNPGLVGASDLPDAWYSRFPAVIEITSNWAALEALGAPRDLVVAAAATDEKRHDPKNGLRWTPQFREIESLWDMIQRTDERTAIGMWVSGLAEQVQTRKLQAAEAQEACRMLDAAGFTDLKVSETSRKIPNLHGYPRAIAR
jgi:MoxR-like ATPase